MAARADSVGMRRIHVFAFRDRDDPESGGSEEHATQVCTHLALAGRDVTLHTGRVPGAAARIERNGFRVVRRGGRVGVFITSVLDERFGRLGPADGIVEIFHGVPFFAPLWSRTPQVGLVHHVHLGTWDALLPGWPGRVGHLIERFAVPAVYRKRTLVTAAASARDEIVTHYRADPDRITIAPHGIAEHFTPGGSRHPKPLIVAVARLMPQKGVDELIGALVAVKEAVPETQATIVGDGPHRDRLQTVAREAGAEWIHWAGRVTDDELVQWYRSAWVVASASRREGFGLTLTEAAACGTPTVATRIPGHVDAVDEGRSGLLAGSTAELADRLVDVLTDEALRASLGAGALAHAEHFHWDEASATLLGALCDEAERRR
ncbi:glycosyltransferase family 4 protein [Actinospongicola halichondriae]|uniref:glycosyltransferase family 4 protein n=1 Tax=Actinospongicola halichondriae TaxID=3236844 RepID=UPI003D4BEAD0